MRIVMAGAVALASACLLVGCEEDMEIAAAADTYSVATATVTGPPVSCVERARITGTQIVDNRTIDFVMEGGELLRNRLPNGCPRLRRDGRFTYRTSLDRVCSTDLITMIQADGGSGQSCGLGLFQPIAPPNRLPARS